MTAGGSCNDPIGTTLAQRLREHARLHRMLSQYADDEQRLWADDLEAAAAELERLRTALQYVLDDEPSGIPRASSTCRSVVRRVRPGGKHGVDGMQRK
jgi:hypothetical protein